MLLFYWLLDTCATNAYLVWRQTYSPSDHSLHPKFHEQLCDHLLAYEKYSPTLGQAFHELTERSGRGYCVWGLHKDGNCVAGGENSKAVWEGNSQRTVYQTSTTVCQKWL